MGFFSSKKTIVVSSVVYNLAGDDDGRTDFLKTAVMGAVTSGSNKGIPGVLQESYLKGPGIKLRSFGRWCRNSGYNSLLGFSSSPLVFTADADRNAVISQIPVEEGESVVLQSLRIGLQDYTYWVDRYLAETNPTLLGTDYSMAFDDSTDTVTLTLADSSTLAFTLSDYAAGEYLYAVYNIMTQTEDPATHEVSTSLSGLKVLIYKRYSGNPTLDAQFVASSDAGTFFPFVPLRINNNFVSDSHLPDVLPLSKKAVKRSLDTSFDDLIDKISENDSLDKIDYAYLVYGVSLNVKDNACKRYIYEFFSQILLGQETSNSSYSTWKAAWDVANATMITWKAWLIAQSEPSDPLYGTPEPPQAVYPMPPSNRVQIASGGRSDLNFDMTISWNYLYEDTGSGILDPAHKVGELWFEVGAKDVWTQEYIVSDYGEQIPVERDMDLVKLHWQVNKNTWKTLTMRGLTHYNRIYGKNTVEISASNALQSGDESGFIVPLHEQIYRNTPLVSSTQMSTACCFVVFNCYEIYKQKWYQTSWFKVLIVIAVIAVTVVTGGAGAGSAGLLGTNLAIGTALGFTGTAAIIAGAIANAVAAMIITQIITTASTAVFGDKIGAIVGVVASLIAIQAGSAFSSSGSLSVNYGELMRADNLLKVTESVGEGWAKSIQANTQSTLQETSALVAEYAKQSEVIAQAYADNIGYGNSILNPARVLIETPDTFLSRTLMTGSDIADLSMGMIGSFTDITLSTELPS